MYNIYEEPKATFDGYEIPIECLRKEYFGSISEEPEKHKLHYHTYIELLYILEGILCVAHDKETFISHPGDFIVINSKELHNAYSAGERVNYFAIKLKPQILYSSDLSVYEAKYALPFLLQNAVWIFSKELFEIFPIENIFENIFSEWDKKTLGYELIIRSHILQLFAWIIRYGCQKYNFNIFQKYKPSSSTIEAIFNFINIPDATDMTCAQAAVYCNMSYSYFCRVFKQIIGVNYTKYWLMEHLNRADQLLVTTDKTITEIASETGFSTDSYFIQCFQRYKGITPRKYRVKLTKSE